MLKHRYLRLAKITTIVSIIWLLGLTIYNCLWFMRNDPDGFRLRNKPVNINQEVGYILIGYIIGVALLTISQIVQEIIKSSISEDSIKIKILKGMTIFRWLIILQGIIIGMFVVICILIYQPAIPKSELFFYMILPVMFAFYLTYLGARVLLLHKQFWRSNISLSIGMIILGFLQTLGGVSFQKMYGLIPGLFYCVLLFFLTRPEVKEQFK